VKRDCVVICIRHKDFSAGTHDVRGLHGTAERCRHGVTVYLLPGLTACQRRAVLRRLRQEASRGVGPALPLPQLTMALVLDRVRSAARTAGAIIRLHPAVTLVPSALAVALMTLFVIASAGGPSLATGRQISLAEAVVGPLGPQAVIVAVVPARPGGLTSAMAASAGLASGQRALGGHARSGDRRGRRAMPYRRWGGWWECRPTVMGAVRVPVLGQPGYGCGMSRLAPYTAHVPDPRAFAT
jgi:hypothetical protein